MKEHDMPTKPGLSITFKEGTHSYKVIFMQKPLGIEFGKTMPMVVANVSGHAAALGVKEGWQIVEIGSKPMTENIDFSEAFRIFKAMIDDRIPNGLSISFKSQSGEVKVFSFNKRPLGFDFPRSMPIIVHKPSGQACQLGVQAGWKIIAIGGSELDDSMAFEKAFDLFKAMTASLPMAP